MGWLPGVIEKSLKIVCFFKVIEKTSNFVTSITTVHGFGYKSVYGGASDVAVFRPFKYVNASYMDVKYWQYIIMICIVL